MPGFQQTALNPSARNANSVVLLIGATTVAFAQSVGHTFGYTTQGLYGVGSAKPQEIQQLRVAPSITLTDFALTLAGETLLQGGVNIYSLLSNNAFDIHVVDGQSGESLFTYVSATTADFNENIPANSPITDTFTFLALDVVDNDGNSLLNVPSSFSIPSTAPIGNGLGLSFAASTPPA